MLPLGEPSALPEPSAPPPASLPPVPAAPAPPTAPVAVAPAAEPKPKSTAISVQNPEPAQPVAGRLPSLAFELQGRAAIGFDATGFDAGGGLAVHWFAQPHVSVRVGIAVRGADVDPANGILVSIAGEAGVAWHPWRAVRGRPFGMSVRFDYLAMEQLLTPYHRENSALDGFIDGTFRFASDADFVLGLGVEQWLGVTYIENGRARIALPALRGVAESGLRLEF
jgi:hypothetical protein